jgi:rhodanese-related sulfurtransferase
MKKLMLVCFVLSLVACTAPSTPQPKTLPEKAADAVSLSASPIKPSNLDEYLLLAGTRYIDVRDPNQFLSEGHVAGFINVPFYGLLVKTESDDFGLFMMTKVVNDQGHVIANYGGVGSFIPRYAESVAIIKYLFPMDMALLVISTAGVESQYLLNLLIQLGYDGTRLYNVGNFSNSLGSLTAYRLRSDVRYLVEGHDAYQLSVHYDFGPLTPLSP